jgi:hypothetical protein
MMNSNAGSDWMLGGGSPPGGSSPEGGSPLGTSPEGSGFWGKHTPETLNPTPFLCVRLELSQVCVRFP